jgi:hypothetical protein
MPGQPGPAFGRPGCKLVPGILLRLAPACLPERDRRVKAGDDKKKTRARMALNQTPAFAAAGS